MKKISQIINRISEIPNISLVVFLLFLLINYGYYIFVLRMPEDSHDTLRYADSAMLIISGNLPISNLTIDIPMGYPLFLALIYSLGGNAETVVLVQLIIFTLSCFFIVWQVVKINKVSGLIFSIFLSIWAADSIIMRMNTRLLPDSLFSTLIIFTLASFIYFYRSNSKSRYLYVFLGIFFASLTRSNGPYLFVLPFAMFFIDFFEKKYKKCLLIFSCSVMVIICLSATNFIVKGYFFPADYHRVKNIFSSNEIKPKELSSNNTQKMDDAVKSIKFYRVFMDYVFHLKDENPSFYYTFIPQRYSAYKSYYCYDCIEKMKLGHDTRSVINFIWQGFSLDHINKDDFTKATNIKQRPPSFFPIANHFFCRTTYFLLHKAFIIVGLFLFFTLFALFMSFKKGINRFSWVIILIISSAHFLSILVLSLAGSGSHTAGSEFISFSQRLIAGSEFLLYLVIILSATLITTKKPIFIRA